MTEREEALGAEVTLDQQLDELTEQGHSLAEPSPRRDSSSRGSPAGRGDVDRRLISVSRLRTELFHSLQAGMTLDEDVYDESGVLLLAAGSKVTARFLQLLRERGINRVRLVPVRSCPPMKIVAEGEDYPSGDGLRTPQSDELDRRMAGELQRPVVFRPVRGWRRPRMSSTRTRLHRVSTHQPQRRISHTPRFRRIDPSVFFR